MYNELVLELDGWTGMLYNNDRCIESFEIIFLSWHLILFTSFVLLSYFLMIHLFWNCNFNKEKDIKM